MAPILQSDISMMDAAVVEHLFADRRLAVQLDTMYLVGRAPNAQLERTDPVSTVPALATIVLREGTSPLLSPIPIDTYQSPEWSCFRFS